VLSPLSTQAQEIEGISFDDDLVSRLLPLDSLINIAMENSPTLDYYDATISKAGFQVEFIKRMWHNNVYGFFNYSTGDQRILTGASNMPGDVTTSNIATGYRAGIQVNIPLYEITGRKSRIRLHEEEKNAAIHKKEELNLELRMHIIAEYYKMLGYYEVVKVRSEGFEAMRTYHLVAEQEFRDGIIALGELSQIKNSLSQAEVYFQDAKYLFMGTLHAFAALIGVPVADLLIDN
jgi:outer membrane protein TolC